MMMRVLCLLFVVLGASSAGAHDLKIHEMLPKNSTAAGVPREAQIFYVEWRQGATHYTSLLADNPDVQKAVGKSLDRPGALCILWSKMAEFASATKKILEARAKETGRAVPGWASDAVTRTMERAEKECRNPTDGYGDASPNLGKRYMEELQKSIAPRQELVRDQELLHALSSLVGAIDEFVKTLPARAGTALQAGSTSVPVLDPRLFLPKECKGVECSL